MKKVFETIYTIFAADNETQISLDFYENTYVWYDYDSSDDDRRASVCWF